MSPDTKKKGSSIEDVRPRSLLLGRSRNVTGINAKIDDLTLRGHEWRGRVTDAVTDGPVTRTMEGASTLSLVCQDTHRKLRQAKLLEERFDLELARTLGFRYVGSSAQGASLTLNFEDREVARLRRHEGAKKAFRDEVTRAEFILMLIREVKGPRIPAWIPELHVEQPIEAPESKPGTKLSVDEGQGEKGLGNTKNLTVKGVAATSAQIRAGEVALHVAAGVGSSWQATAGMMVALIVESVLGSASSNWFELIPSTASCSGVDPGDLATGAKTFLTKGWCGPPSAEDAARQNGNDIAAIAQAVQKSGAGASSNGHANYGPYVKEAIQWVQAFNGGDLPSGSVTSTTTTVKRYAFERRPNEDSWTCIQRLAEEVQWRAFVSNGIFYYISEPKLREARIEMRVNSDLPGVDEIDWEYDLGKDLQELTVTGRADAWAAPPGTVAHVTGEGEPVNGRYLVASIESNLFKDDVNVTLKRPTKPLPEPAPETKTTSDTSSLPGTSTAGGGTECVGNWNGHEVCGWIDQILRQAQKDGVNFTVESGCRTTAESIAACQNICGADSCPGTCAGASSNHNGCTGGKGAVDIGAGCEELRSWLARHGNPLRNALPADTCHFSRDGH